MTTGSAGPAGPALRRHEGVLLVALTWVATAAFWRLSGPVAEAPLLEALMKLGVWAAIASAALFLTGRREPSSVFARLGLAGRGGRITALVVVATLPMALTAIVVRRQPLSAEVVLANGLIGPLAEEVLFRGFLLFQLVTRAGWSPASALIVSSIVFGLAHIPGVESDVLALLRGPVWTGGSWTFSDGVVVASASGAEVWWRFVESRVPVLTASLVPYALGGVVFGWLALRCYCIWPAVALHCLMNFWWDLARGERFQPIATADPMAVAQLVTVGLALWLTWRARSVATA